MEIDLKKSAGLDAMCEVARLKGIERGLRKRWRSYMLRGTVTVAGAVALSHITVVGALCLLWWAIIWAFQSREMAKMIDSIWENQ